jgi:peptidyl-tRNA hydrolase
VLKKYSKSDRKIADEAVEQAADAVECFLSEGLSTAMNKFNTKKESLNPSDGPESSD